MDHVGEHRNEEKEASPRLAGQRWDGFMVEVELKFVLEEGLFSHSQDAGERLGNMNKM